jgi:hypothetical protein
MVSGARGKPHAAAFPAQGFDVALPGEMMHDLHRVIFGNAAGGSDIIDRRQPVCPAVRAEVHHHALRVVGERASLINRGFYGLIRKD